MYPNFCSISRCHFEAGSERDDEYRRWPNPQFAIGNYRESEIASLDHLIGSDRDRLQHSQAEGFGCGQLLDLAL
jgi:hypothetical protein